MFSITLNYLMSGIQFFQAGRCKNKKIEIKIKFEITFIEISNFTIRK